MFRGRPIMTVVIAVLFVVLLLFVSTGTFLGGLPNLDSRQYQAIENVQKIADAMNDFHGKYGTYWNRYNMVIADSSNRLAFSERGVDIAPGDPYRYTLKFFSDSAFTVFAERNPGSDSTFDMFSCDQRGALTHLTSKRTK